MDIKNLRRQAVNRHRSKKHQGGKYRDVADNTNEEDIAENEEEKSVVKDEKDENDPSRFANLKRETDDIAALRQNNYSKRKIISNWDRYEVSIREDYESEENSAADFSNLLSAPIVEGNRFKFRHEHLWDIKQNQDDALFTPNLQLISEGLSSIPFCERLNLPEILFNNEQLEAIKSSSEIASSTFKTIVTSSEAGKKPKEITAEVNQNIINKLMSKGPSKEEVKKPNELNLSSKNSFENDGRSVLNVSDNVQRPLKEVVNAWPPPALDQRKPREKEKVAVKILLNENPKVENNIDNTINREELVNKVSDDLSVSDGSPLQQRSTKRRNNRNTEDKRDFPTQNEVEDSAEDKMSIPSSVVVKDENKEWDTSESVLEQRVSRRGNRTKDKKIEEKSPIITSSDETGDRERNQEVMLKSSEPMTSKVSEEEVVRGRIDGEKDDEKSSKVFLQDRVNHQEKSNENHSDDELDYLLSLSVPDTLQKRLRAPVSMTTKTRLPDKPEEKIKKPDSKKLVMKQPNKPSNPNCDDNEDLDDWLDSILKS